MFEVKIKTLDGTNASFDVEDDMTVLQFKELIADKVNIPAGQQKLIYCGKVLQNDKKLKEYNVHEKVVHVVKSVNPPTSGASTSRAADTTSSQRSGVNTIVGDVPSNLLPDVFSSMLTGANMPQVQHINLSRRESNQSESMRRIILIRQWIRDSHSLLDRIHDASKNTDLTGDTLTPEARESSQSSHGQITSIEVTQRSNTGSSTASATANEVPMPIPTSASSSNNQQSSPPGGSSGRQTAAGTSQSRAPNGRAPRNPDIEVLSSVWKEVDALQSRFNPFLQRYKAIINRTANRCVNNQHYFNIVQSVLHSIAHIYHAVSDLTADVNRSGIIELQAQNAPVPPPTAIIQQTIPVSIPIRATLNLSPNTARRALSTNNGTTSTTRTTTQTSSGMPTPLTVPPPSTETRSSQLFADVQVDMETDESNLDGNSASPFNLQQIISDAVNAVTGLAGVSGVQSTAATTSTRTTAPTTSTSASTAQFNPQFPAGLFPQIPGLPDLNTLLPGAGLGPALPLGGPVPSGAFALPNMPQMSSHSSRTRQDPYLMSCNSKYWQRNNQSNQNQAAGQSSTRTTATTSARTTTQAANSTPQPVPPPTFTLPTRTSDIVYPTIPGPENESAGSSSLDQTSQLRGEFLLSSLRRCLEPRAVASPSSQAQLDSLFSTVSSEMNAYNQTGQIPATNLQSLLSSLGELVVSPSHRLRGMDLGLFATLINILLRELTLPETLAVLQRDGRALDRLRAPLRNYLRTDILNGGAPTNENIASAVDRLLIPIRALFTQISSSDSETTTDLDMSVSLTSYLREKMLELFNYVVNSRADCQEFGTQLLDKLISIVIGYLRLLYYGYRGDQTHIMQHYSNLMNRICVNAQNQYGTGVTSWLIETLRTIILNTRSNWESSPMSSINSHITYRNSSSNNTVNSINANQRQLIHDTVSSGEEEFEDAQSEVRSGHVCSHTHHRQQNNSLLASEWRNIVPADWVSIIEEDVKRQLAQQSLEDEPYSDAYMAGRPNKKRKINEDSETDS